MSLEVLILLGATPNGRPNIPSSSLPRNCKDRNAIAADEAPEDKAPKFTRLRIFQVFFESPGLGSPERGHPDLFRFPRFLPICSNLRSLFSGMSRFVPICCDLLRFLPICSDLFSEQIRTNQGNRMNFCGVVQGMLSEIQELLTFL